MLPALVRAHAESHPDRPAVVAGRRRMTYGELDSHVSRLVGLLRERGIGRGHLVGVHLDRTAESVAAMLAVLGAGAAYTVIEPTEPAAEGAGRLAAAGPDLVLTSSRHAGQLLRHGLSVLDAADGTDGVRVPLADAGESETAYVLYTSGSTGVPKGVMVSHANIRHYTESLLARLGITEPLRYAHVTTLAADLGNTSLFLALWTGGTLHLIDDATRRDPLGLYRHLRAERIDVLKTTPSHWSVVFRAFDQAPATGPALRFLLLGGELLGLPLARRILASGVARTLVNHYGPTEATVGVTAHVLGSEADLDGLRDVASVPIGTGLGRTRLFVRSADGRFHERDAVGELYVTGPSVAVGYRGDAASTAAAFTGDLDELHPGLGRAYRTGDRVRADADGVLEFLGRGDRQVKISGYRVELGHVENGLRRLPSVADAVVLHRPGRRPALVAAVAVNGDPRPEDLRQELRESLPSYMIPDRIETFDAFPRNENGKTDHGTLRDLVEARITERARPSRAVADPVLADVCAAWERSLGHGGFGVDDDFADVAGSSIDAIAVIANLQAQGYQVSATAFLEAPTPTALAGRLRAGAHGTAHPPYAAATVDDGTALSPAQSWFFAQSFAQPDHWNQALLLDVDGGVREPELAAAVEDVAVMHPMLHTAFTPHPANGAAGRRRETAAADGLFTTSVLPDGDGAVARHIREVAAVRQREISVTDGRLFKVHLFRGAERAHLLLICHHLAIDAVSWRIVLGDLVRCYGERLRGAAPRRPRDATGFGAWAAHLRDRADELRGDLVHWEAVARFPALPAGPGDAGDNREGDAQSVWFGLSREETGALIRTAAARGAAPQVVLLAAFAQALSEPAGTDELVVDVESHGRTTLDETVEISRVVGWFTSVFPVRVAVTAGDLEATEKSASAAMDEVPRLGVAYALHEQPRRADVCFNYLGSFTLPHSGDLLPTVSRYAVGPVRGPDNDRVYGLKLTARIHEGRLIADLSFTARRHDPERMRGVFRATRAYLLRAAGLPPAEGQIVVEHGSSTGLLVQVPRALHDEAPAGAIREYGEVLLTGATGFIGVHLLHLLLVRTNARVHCVVREQEGRPALDRLSDAYAWYLPGERLDRYADRIAVYAGDLTEPGLGVGDETYDLLSREVEAIYHLAADTRLFGERESFTRHNVDSVRMIVGLATAGRPKDLHYVSTLAVCGGGPAGEPVVFSEDSLDIGQDFLNEYERSKYEAERVVHEFVAQGGAGFIYRSGNVTGHSVSGRFQRNGGASRLVQLLRACAHLGRVPRVGARALALSPVDIVAEGILEISRSAPLRGGTFHVDTHHHVPYEEIFAALRDLGCVLDEDEAPGFADLFGRHLGEGDGDELVSLAYFWANRPERNVRYDHSRTRRTLLHLGVEFPELRRAWLRDFLTGLIQQGELPLVERGEVVHD